MAEKAAFSTLALELDSSVPIHVSLVLFELLPSIGAQSKCICQQVSLLEGPLRGLSGTLAVVSHPEGIPIGFHSCLCGESSSWHW